MPLPWGILSPPISPAGNTVTVLHLYRDQWANDMQMYMANWPEMMRYECSCIEDVSHWFLENGMGFFSIPPKTEAILFGTRVWQKNSNNKWQWPNRNSSAIPWQWRWMTEWRTCTSLMLHRVAAITHIHYSTRNVADTWTLPRWSDTGLHHSSWTTSIYCCSCTAHRLTTSTCCRSPVPTSYVRRSTGCQFTNRSAKLAVTGHHWQDMIHWHILPHPLLTACNIWRYDKWQTTDGASIVRQSF